MAGLQVEEDLGFIPGSMSSSSRGAGSFMTFPAAAQKIIHELRDMKVPLPCTYTQLITLGGSQTRRGTTQKRWRIRDTEWRGGQNEGREDKEDGYGGIQHASVSFKRMVATFSVCR